MTRNDSPLPLLLAAGLAAAGCERLGEPPVPPAVPVSLAVQRDLPQAGCPHRIDAARCPFCTPALLESEGFCGQHGVPEAQCWICRPFLVEAYRAVGDWCGAHGLPESHCRVCNPLPAKAAAPRFAEAQKRREAATPPAAMRRIEQAPNAFCATSRSVIRFASEEIPQLAGIEFETVVEAPLRRTILRTVVLDFDRNRYARLSSRAAGVIAEVRADLGQAVRRGDVLAVVDSAVLGEARAALRAARETVALAEARVHREQSLLEQRVGTQQALREAEAALVEARIAWTGARQRLHNLGLTGEQIERVENDGESSSLLELRAPLDGVVVQRDAVIGEVIEPSHVLFAVADTGTLWALIRLAESDLTAVAVGQPALFTFDGLPGRTFEGAITWISPQIDAATRTLTCRADVQNSGGLLRANHFGWAELVVRQEQTAVLVPREAVQWEGCCNVVFVPENPQATEIRPRQVRLGLVVGGLYEVLEGLAAGERVATRGSYLLKTELLKGSIGAGCCEVEHLDK